MDESGAAGNLCPSVIEPLRQFSFTLINVRVLVTIDNMA